MLTIRRCNVPLFMQNGSFFLGLDLLDDEPFDVPADCFKENACVRSDIDLLLLLRVVRFWGLNTLPVEIFEYMLSYTPRSLDERLVREFPELTVLLSKVLHVKEAAAPNCISVAISSGLEISTIRMLHEKGYSWNETACESAAQMNDLECLKYLHTEGCPWDERTLLAAINSNSTMCLQYALDNDCPRQSRLIMDTAAQLGRIDSIKILQRAGSSWDSTTFAAAIRGNQLEVLHFLHTRGCDFPPDAACLAAAQGNVEMLAFVHQHGSDLSDTCKAAASAGSVECLQYAHEHGAAWHVDVCMFAASGGHLDCLRYAHEHGCPWDEETVKAAVSARSWGCFTYAFRRRAGWWQHFVATIYLHWSGTIFVTILNDQTGKQPTLKCLEMLCVLTNVVVYMLILYRRHIGNYLSVRSADRVAQSYFCLLLLFVTGDGILEASWPVALLRAIVFVSLAGVLVVINVYYVTFELTFLLHQE